MTILGHEISLGILFLLFLIVAIGIAAYLVLDGYAKKSFYRQDKLDELKEKFHANMFSLKAKEEKSTEKKSVLAKARSNQNQQGKISLSKRTD